MMTVANSLLPIILVIALGVILRSTGFLSKETFDGMNKLCYWVALPVLLFHKVSSVAIEGGPAMRMFAVLLMNAATPLLNRWTVPRPLGGPVPVPSAGK